MTKKSEQTIEYLENEDEIKRIIHYFGPPVIKANTTTFLEGDSTTLRHFSMRNFPIIKSSSPLQITACMPPILSFRSFQFKRKLNFDQQINMENILRSLLFKTEVNIAKTVYNWNANHSAFFSFLKGTFTHNFDICMSVPLLYIPFTFCEAITSLRSCS